MTTQERVLVTGGTGLIGSEVASVLLHRGATPVLLDTRPNMENVARLVDHVVLRVGSVTDKNLLREVIEEQGVTRVIHLAALLTLDADEDAAAAVDVNCIGTTHVFELAVEAGIRRTVWTSTAAVYGSRPYYDQRFGRHTVTEDDPVAPASIYAGTKHMCEVLAGHFRRRGADIVGLRPVMTFGARRFSGAVGLLNQAVRDAVVDGHGIVTQPWSADSSINPMYVTDCAEAVVRTCLHEEPLALDVYNMGTGEYLSLSSMLEAVAAELPSGASIELRDAPPPGSTVPLPTFDLPDLDSRALRHELRWTPQHDFSSAAAAWVQAHRAGGGGRDEDT